MFWAFVAAPFCLLAIAALIAPKSKPYRVAIALAAIFVGIDVAVVWATFGQPTSSTGGLSFAAIALVESGFAIAVLVASVVVRRSSTPVR